jgi:hypothetical protein
MQKTYSRIIIVVLVLIFLMTFEVTLSIAKSQSAAGGAATTGSSQNTSSSSNNASSSQLAGLSYADNDWPKSLPNDTWPLWEPDWWKEHWLLTKAWMWFMPTYDTIEPFAVLCYRLDPANSSSQPFILKPINDIQVDCPDKPDGKKLTIKDYQKKEYEEYLNKLSNLPSSARSCKDHKNTFNVCTPLDENHHLNMDQQLFIAVDATNIPSEQLKLIKLLNINVTNQPGTPIFTSPMAPSPSATSATIGGTGGNAAGKETDAGCAETHMGGSATQIYKLPQPPYPSYTDEMFACKKHILKQFFNDLISYGIVSTTTLSTMLTPTEKKFLENDIMQLTRDSNLTSYITTSLTTSRLLTIPLTAAYAHAMVSCLNSQLSKSELYSRITNSCTDTLIKYCKNPSESLDRLKSTYDATTLDEDLQKLNRAVLDEYFLSSMYNPRQKYFFPWPVELSGDTIPTVSVNIVYTLPAPGKPWTPFTFYPEGSVVIPPVDRKGSESEESPVVNNNHYYIALTGGISGIQPPCFPIKAIKDNEILWWELGINSTLTSSTTKTWQQTHSYNLGDIIQNPFNGLYYAALTKSSTLTGKSGSVPPYFISPSNFTSLESTSTHCTGISNKYPGSIIEKSEERHSNEIKWYDIGATAPASISVYAQPADQVVNVLDQNLPQVHTLYNFILSAGVVYSSLKNNSYGFSQTPTTSGASSPQYQPIQTSSSTIIDPVLFLTWYPFKLDDESQWQWRDLFRFPGLSIGLSLNTPASNFYGGVTIEPIRYVQLSGGVTYAKVTELAPQSTFNPTPSASNSAPATVTDFHWGYFFGVTFNFSNFIQSLFGGSK